MILWTDNGDGSADFTVSVEGDSHKFSVAIDEETAVVSYEETLTHYGEIRVAEPREEIFKLLMQSDEITEFLDQNNVKNIRRDRNHR